MAHYHQLSPTYPLLIGDGDPLSSVAKFIDNTENNHNITYLKFKDASAKDYFLKMEAMVTKVTTPYIMFCDNDDFIIPTGVEKSIEFLDKNQDYISCGGLILGITPHLKNNNMLILEQKNLYDNNIDVDQNSPYARVLYYLENYRYPCWYNVCRKEAILNSLRLFIKSGINDFLLMELFLALSLSVLGKQRFLKNDIQYIRQTNSSQTNASIKGFFYRLVTTNLGQEIIWFIESLKQQLNTTTPKISNAPENDLTLAYVKYLENTSSQNNYSKLDTMVSFWRRIDYSLRYFFPLYNSMRLQGRYTSLKRYLKQQGSTPEEMVETEKNLNLVHKIIFQFPKC